MATTYRVEIRDCGWKVAHGDVVLADPKDLTEVMLAADAVVASKGRRLKSGMNVEVWTLKGTPRLAASVVKS